MRRYLTQQEWLSLSCGEHAPVVWVVFAEALFNVRFDCFVWWCFLFSTMGEEMSRMDLNIINSNTDFLWHQGGLDKRNRATFGHEAIRRSDRLEVVFSVIFDKSRLSFASA